MNLEKFVVVAGIPGVHKIVNTRPNGLIIEDKLENRTRFVPVRSNQFTPLATVGVYVETDQDTMALGDVWQRMFDQIATHPPVPQSSNGEEFRAYFSSVLPEHDKDRVHITDIKKCLKWFTFLNDRGLIAQAIAADAAKAQKEVAESAASTDVDAADQVESLA